MSVTSSPLNFVSNGSALYVRLREFWASLLSWRTRRPLNENLEPTVPDNTPKSGLRQWLVDAFTPVPFGGNAAMVVEPLDRWPSQDWMQRLAAENNVGATAFLVRSAGACDFELRWFTPKTEVPLCGHATLAAAHVLVSELGHLATDINFGAARGELTVRPSGRGYELSLPALVDAKVVPAPSNLAQALGAEPKAVWIGFYLLVILEHAQTVMELTPDLETLKAISLSLGGQGNVGVAAMADVSSNHDVVDRFFAPGYGIPEDAATGSFHAMLTPIIAAQLGRDEVRFRQAYPGRGAEIVARLEGDLVRLIGEAVIVGRTELRIAPEWA